MALESYLLGAFCAFMLGMLFARMIRSGPPVDAYRHEAPALDAAHYFEGTWHAGGIMEDISGRVVARYHVVLTVADSKDGAIWAETWHDEAAGSEQRAFQIQANAAGELRGSGSHIRGELYGKQRGKAMELRYGLKRTIGNKETVFSVVERIYAVNDKYFIRKTQLRKCGIAIVSFTAGYYKETI